MSTSSAPTLEDVAREAGVSLATASRVVNGSTRRVAEAYRERVLAAAAKLNYTPNLSAQAVAKGTSNTVTLLVADISDPFFSTIAAGVANAAEKAGLVVTIAVTGRDPLREAELVRSLRGQRPRVMVLAGSRVVDGTGRDVLVDELDAFAANGGRVVIISQHELPFATVSIDNRAGARDLAIELVEAGYRSFAILGGAVNLMTARDRVEGFVEGAATAGVAVSPERIRTGEFTRDGGYASMLELIDAGLEDIDLVFAVNDVMAIGAMAALRDRGVRVPEQIAIAGFDDVSSARDVTPPLTTVRIPLEEVGRTAVEIALGEDGHTASAAVASSVVLRESTPRRV